MPSASGVYSLPPGYLAVTGERIIASQHNPPLEDIAAALTLRLSRDGSAPMTGPLKSADGAVGLPALTFSSDPTTGFYKTTSGFGVSIAGTKVAEFVAGGVVGARYLGELIPFTGSTAPALTVLPYGQTLSRVTYPALWAFAQTEIAAGNVFYNNGDGSTTFGIGDLRGRTVFGKDNMGGTGASRLTSTYTGAANILGTGVGSESQTLTAAQVGTHNHPVYLNDPGHAHLTGGQGGAQTAQAGSSQTGLANVSAAPTNAALTALTVRDAPSGNINQTAQNTGGNPHPNVPPGIIVNFALFVGA